MHSYIHIYNTYIHTCIHKTSVEYMYQGNRMISQHHIFPYDYACLTHPVCPVNCRKNVVVCIH